MIARLALDTNVYTAWGRGDSNIQKIVTQATNIGLPIPVLGEVYFGMFNGTKQSHNERVLASFLANNRVEILQIDETTAKIFGEIATHLQRAGKPIQQNDIWIAALCKQYNYRLATRDNGFTTILGLELFEF